MYNVYADDQGAIALPKNPEYYTRTKHIDIQWHWVRDEMEAGRIKLNYIPTADMVVDGLTKPLAHEKYEEFVKAPNMA